MRFTFGNNYICTYCGEPADTVDHTIPYSFFKESGYGGKRRAESIGFMTYCCRECNVILANRIFPTFQERCKFLNTSLKKRYKKFMRVLWDEDELNELSGSLREEIARSNRLNKRIRERISWQSSDYFLDMLKETMDRIYYCDKISPEQKEFFIDTDYIP